MFVQRPPAGSIEVAGLAAGVVLDSQVNGMPSSPSKYSSMLENPATWSYIWVSLAFLYLVGIYLGMIVIKKRAE